MTYGSVSRFSILFAAATIICAQGIPGPKKPRRNTPVVSSAPVQQPVEVKPSPIAPASEHQRRYCAALDRYFTLVTTPNPDPVATNPIQREEERQAIEARHVAERNQAAKDVALALGDGKLTDWTGQIYQFDVNDRKTVISIGVCWSSKGGWLTAVGPMAFGPNGKATGIVERNRTSYPSELLGHDRLPLQYVRKVVFKREGPKYGADFERRL